jgi:hypothetical protein
MVLPRLQTKVLTKDAGRRLYIPPFLFRTDTKLLAPVRSLVSALLPRKGVLPNRRHHPFSRQPEQRYNTLDFACGKIVCQRAAAPLDAPRIFFACGPNF